MTGDDTELFPRIIKSGSKSCTRLRVLSIIQSRKGEFESNIVARGSVTTVGLLHAGQGGAFRQYRVLSWDSSASYSNPRENADRWILSFESKRHFYYEQRVCQLAGQIISHARVERARLSR
jgi:hypothetical protein